MPDEFGPMLAYAWVGGSIGGVQLGGLASVVLGLVVLRSNWRKSLPAAQPSAEPDRNQIRPAPQ